LKGSLSYELFVTIHSVAFENLSGFRKHKGFAGDAIQVLTPGTARKQPRKWLWLQNTSSKETSHKKGLEIFHIYTSKLTH